MSIPAPYPFFYRKQVEMPDSYCYRVVDLPDKGQGVIATRDIQMGELIIHEKPLIILPWWIRHSIYPRNEKMKYLKKALSDMSQYDLQTFFQLHDSKCQSGEEKTEDGIWRTNNFALGMAGARSDNGLFVKMSRFNHSCVPSAEFHWNETFKRQEIRAIRNIPKGEEITICYFTIEIAVHSQAERKRFLLDHYGFSCDCPHCSFKGDMEKKNDKDRHNVYLLEKRVDKLLYYVPPDSEDSGESENDSDIERIYTNQGSDCESSEAADIEHGLDLCFKRLQLMTDLGFKVVSRLRLCKTILETAMEWDIFDKEMAIVDQGLELAEMLHGQNSEEYIFWKKHQERVKLFASNGNNPLVIQAFRAISVSESMSTTSSSSSDLPMSSELSSNSLASRVSTPFIKANTGVGVENLNNVQSQGDLELNKFKSGQIDNKTISSADIVPIRNV